MDWELDGPETRVLGCMLEKEIATPDYYPLSLNGLVNACNQKSNREPVVSYTDDQVEDALAGLRSKGLAVRITGESRVPKHAQRFTEQFNLGRREAAVLCVLMLRGPQTIGEIRGRTERLYPFDDLGAVESTLQRLAEAGFVKKLAKQAGNKDPRFAHLLGGDVSDDAPATPEGRSPDRERIEVLEAEVAQLRREFQEFRRRFE